MIPLLTLLISLAHAEPDVVTVTQRAADLSCIYCSAFISDGGGTRGHTAALLDLHVISSRYDVAFPRALQARLESDCASCQPAAFTAQARGLSPTTTVWAANLEAYSEGRASVAELNIAARAGGYVLDVVPVRMPDGTASRVDAVMKVEGFEHDPAAAVVGAVLDVRVRPQAGVVVIPATEGCTIVVATADGRMREEWCLVAGAWSRRVVVDGVAQ